MRVRFYVQGAPSSLTHSPPLFDTEVPTSAATFVSLFELKPSRCPPWLMTLLDFSTGLLRSPQSARVFWEGGTLIRNAGARIYRLCTINAAATRTHFGLRVSREGLVIFGTRQVSNDRRFSGFCFTVPGLFGCRDAHKAPVNALHTRPLIAQSTFDAKV